MTSADYKKPRSKLDFPQCARDALIRIGEYTNLFNFIFDWQIINHNQFGVCEFSVSEGLCTSKKNQDRCYELITECVFLEKKTDTKKGNHVGLTVFQEFQLVLVLVEYFSRPGPDVTRNDVFLCLFGHTTLTQIRSRVLSKFISTAISDSIAPVNVPLATLNVSHFTYPK